MTAHMGVDMAAGLAAHRDAPERAQDAQNPLGRAKEKQEQMKASVRTKVEHGFHVVKCLFKHRKMRYRGLAKHNSSCSRCSASPTWRWRAGSLTTCTPSCVLSIEKAWEMHKSRADFPLRPINLTRKFAPARCNYMSRAEHCPKPISSDGIHAALP